jgi:streptomycin 6-kinase
MGVGRAVTDDANRDRLHAWAARWDVAVHPSILETTSSLIAFGTRGDDGVVLKVVKRRGDEWHAGRVIRAFDGRGIVRALEVDDGAMLLERATPGVSLVDVVASGDDDRATRIVGNVIRSLSPRDPPDGTASVEDWGRAFEQYRATGDQQIPPRLVAEAHATYADLAASQTNRRLLHGDLQHSNILFDEHRGWIAIDPKGVIGEPEFDVSPFLRNPFQMSHLFNRRDIVERRLRILCDEAGLRYERALRWSFALAVLSAIWSVEDDGVVHDDSPALMLAAALRPSIGSAAS